MINEVIHELTNLGLAQSTFVFPTAQEIRDAKQKRPSGHGSWFLVSLNPQAWRFACLDSEHQSEPAATVVHQREIMLFIGKKPKGRSIMISNASNPLKESRKESLLRCAGCTFICV